MKPHAALLAGLSAVVLSAGAAAAEPRGGAFAPGAFRGPGFRPVFHPGHVPGRPVWFHHRGGAFCCGGFSTPAVVGTVFPGWTAFQAPSAFGPWGNGSPGVPQTVVNVNVAPQVYTTGTLPTAADLPAGFGAVRQPPGAPVLYVLNGSGRVRPGGARVISVGPGSGAGTSSGFSEDNPTAPKIIELQTE